jgi:hypothetical protein
MDQTDRTDEMNKTGGDRTIDELEEELVGMWGQSRLREAENNACYGKGHSRRSKNLELSSSRPSRQSRKSRG